MEINPAKKLSGFFRALSSFPSVWSKECTKAFLTARYMGVSSLKRVENNGKYSSQHDSEYPYSRNNDFYLLKMKNDGIVNFKKMNYKAAAILYDEDLNIIENIDLDRDTPDINVSLPQGNYFLRPTEDNRYPTMVILNP